MYIVMILGALTVLLVWQIVSNVFLSPLRNIPGPFLAKVTPKWLIFVDLAGYRTLTLHKLHQRYGSAVRIGPQEVSFSNPEMVKEIYGQQTVFMKAPIYDNFSSPPIGIFSMRGKAQHSERRRLLSHAFSQVNLSETEPLIEQQIQKLVRRVEANLSKPLDMLELFRMTAFDIVGELFLGQSFGGLDSDRPPQFLVDMDNAFIIGSLERSFPWMCAILRFLHVPAVENFLASRVRLSGYGERAFKTYVAQYGRDSGRKDLLTKVLAGKTNQDDAPLTDAQIQREISNLVFAGTDTTSTTLTYLFWEFSRHPELQSRLRAELASKNGGIEGLPTYKHIIDLPVLDALIQEGLRLHPAAPASLPRETPSGGRVLNGVFIPEKTIVSMQCYTTQRDPTAFPNPDAFVPERWLEAKSITGEMKTLFMPFSTGSRACLGKNLAMMELKLITATLVKNFTIQQAPETTEDCMVMKDHFLALPKGGKCNLIFSRVG